MDIWGFRKSAAILTVFSLKDDDVIVSSVQLKMQKQHIVEWKLESGLEVWHEDEHL